MSRPNTVAHFVNWARSLRLEDGSPFIVQPFQRKPLKDIFAGVPEIWDIEPEGNGKTTKLAAQVIYHGEHTIGAAVPVAAATRDQAMILYRQASGFIRRSELPNWKCQDGYRRLVNTKTGALIQIFAADAGHGGARLDREDHARLDGVVG